MCHQLNILNIPASCPISSSFLGIQYNYIYYQFFRQRNNFIIIKNVNKF
jgi:hypothetical protein